LSGKEGLKEEEEKAGTDLDLRELIRSTGPVERSHEGVPGDGEDVVGRKRVLDLLGSDVAEGLFVDKGNEARSASSASNVPLPFLFPTRTQTSETHVLDPLLSKLVILTSLGHPPGQLLLDENSLSLSVPIRDLRKTLSLEVGVERSSSSLGLREDEDNVLEGGFEESREMLHVLEGEVGSDEVGEEGEGDGWRERRGTMGERRRRSAFSAQNYERAR